MQNKEQTNRLLIIEDDLGLQKQLKWCFEDYEVLFAANRADAISLVKKYRPSVVLQDLGLPPDESGATEGLASLEEILAISPFTKVIVVTGNHDRENALIAVSLGAYDFYQKPLEVDVLRLIVNRAFHIHQIEEQNRMLRASKFDSKMEGIIVTDDGMQKVCNMIEKVAPANITVLITGESGTGKELVARAIHAHSNNAGGKFVAINCAAIPEQLLEAELFGYEKGAFTGAVKQTLGKVELADGGTLFLDEIGDMPLALQAKLLRFLQNRVIERIGGRVEIPVDTRVVCATNRDLHQMMSEQKFREDLFYRIGEVIIPLPALRNRPGAPVIIAHSILNRILGDSPRTKKRFSDDAIVALDSHTWPGNIRELENKVKTACLMAEGAFIRAHDLALGGASLNSQLLSLKEVRSRAERQAIEQALAVCDGNLSKTAEVLDVTRPTLYDLLDKYKIKYGK